MAAGQISSLAERGRVLPAVEVFDLLSDLKLADAKSAGHGCRPWEQSARFRLRRIKMTKKARPTGRALERISKFAVTFYLRRRKSRAAPPKPASANVAGSGVGVGLKSE